MPMSSPVSVIPTSFAAVDCETSCLHPTAHHRIIELAVVSLGEDWAPSDVWCSLLCPERDLGPTDIHGIRGHRARECRVCPWVRGLAPGRGDCTRRRWAPSLLRGSLLRARGSGDARWEGGRRSHSRRQRGG